MLTALPWLLLALCLAGWLYVRAGLIGWVGAAAAAIVVAWELGSPHGAIVASSLLVAVLTVLGSPTPLRRWLLSRPLLGLYRKKLPALSETERIALSSGTVGFEGEIFSGAPHWEKLRNQPAPRLSFDEQVFLSGPVEEVCALANEWEITHELNDLPEEIWALLGKHRFFGMIIPKEFGGLGFSAFAHHRVVQKLASVSTTLSSTVGVPNSLGPAELLMHYGTAEQKKHYLPRLATGQDIPCFALTGPFAGSDATSIPDYGTVCKREINGQMQLGLCLNFSKRYITLAPVATLIGLAFRLYDPEHLLGPEKDRGITLALVPRNTPGVRIGRRHFPLNAAFQNGPLEGEDVFIPLDNIIGGPEYAGQGWRMLVECLSIGRSITLPSSASGGARMIALATGAYARIRQQFGVPVSRFEGVVEALARIGGNAYAISALSRASACAVDRGEVPAVPSAIAKYHCTEMGRKLVADAMDVHGGKGIILGPKNYLGRAWQTAPIGITVEGANIMTRSLMIFGQGAILCHPWVMKEMQAASNPDRAAGLRAFDRAAWLHVRGTLSCAVRSFVLGLTQGRMPGAPGDDATRRIYQKLNRYCAALTLLTDVSMAMLGGKLKVRESLSGRLGDVLSKIYLVCAMLKRFEDEARLDDLPVLSWAVQDALHGIEQALHNSLLNFPSPITGWLLRRIVFPLGAHEREPTDRANAHVAWLLSNPSATRERLGEGVYLGTQPNHPAGCISAYLEEAARLEPIGAKFQKIVKHGGIEALSFSRQLDEAVREQWLTPEERTGVERLREIVLDVISVDDFEPSDLSRTTLSTHAADKPALRSVRA